jgi:phage-related protein
MSPKNDKELAFFQAAYDVYTKFPEHIQDDGGYQLHLLQNGMEPADFKPLKRVGPGAYELRLDDETNEYRVVYVAKLDNKVWVLHAFQKKTRTTRDSDIESAKDAYKALVKMLHEAKVLQKKAA